MISWKGSNHYPERMDMDTLTEEEFNEALNDFENDFRYLEAMIIQARRNENK